MNSVIVKRGGDGRTVFLVLCVFESLSVWLYIIISVLLNVLHCIISNSFMLYST